MYGVLNGDGIADFGVSEQNNSSGVDFAGTTYIVFGQETLTVPVPTGLPMLLAGLGLPRYATQY